MRACVPRSTSLPAEAGLPVRRSRDLAAAQLSPYCIQTRLEALRSAPSEAASSGQARRWPDLEASEAPVEVGRDQLPEHVATQEGVTLDGEKHLRAWRGRRIVSARRQSPHSAWPAIRLLAAYTQGAQEQSRFRDSASSFAGRPPHGKMRGSRRAAFCTTRPPSRAHSRDSGLLPPREGSHFSPGEGVFSAEMRVFV